MQLVPRRVSFTFAWMSLAMLAISAAAAQHYPRPLANDARVDNLIGQMTLEEKVALIRGAAEPATTYQGQAGYIAGVPRLHIPPLRFADGPPGVLTRIPSHAETATMGVAATFSVRDAEANGHLIGKDARALGIDVALQPFINIDRDISFARGFNTFGEDPFLAGQIGAAEIRGIQAEDVMAMAKHFIGFDSNGYNDFIDEQALYEVYVAPFRDAVNAGVAAVMCSYNKVNGLWACGNGLAQKNILKGELGFQGFVTSDWGAVHSVDYINQGMDMEMPGVVRPERLANERRPSFFVLHENEISPPLALKTDNPPGGHEVSLPEETSMDRGNEPVPWNGDGSSLYAALRDGTVTEATVTAAARRVLREMDRFGYLDGRQKHSVTPQSSNVGAAVIEKTSEDSAVLLRNENRALPLTSKDLTSLALIGPTAGQVDAIGLFNERSGGLPERQVGPLEALRRLAPEARITYAVDDDMTGTLIPSSHLSHNGIPGLVRNTAGVESVDQELNFTSSNARALPPNSAAVWSGSLSVDHTGEYWIYLQVLGGRGRLSIDGRLVGRTGAIAGGVHGDTQQAAQDNAMPTIDGLDNVRHLLQLSSGPHSIKVELNPDGSGNPAQIRLNWMPPEARLANRKAAIRAARSANAAVVFVWSRRKPVFGLPGDQDRLIEEVAAANPNTIVVLNTSQPIAMPWLRRVKAVVQMWWPGDEGGWATAKVLLGKANPAGRLPVTWAKKLSDYAPHDPAHPERSDAGVQGKTTYSEGVLVGYRWFDTQKIEPMFPFGHGLSYTQFSYSDMSVQTFSDGSADVKVRIKNIGELTGDEVPQVYLSAPARPPSGAQFAPRTLVSFDRITLKPEESRVVTLHISPRAFEYWSMDQKQWLRPEAGRRIYVGASSRDLRTSAALDHGQ